MYGFSQIKTIKTNDKAGRLWQKKSCHVYFKMLYESAP